MEKAVLCYKADQLVGSLPNFRSVQSSLAVSKFSCCRIRTLRTRPQTCVCKLSMPDVVASKAQSQLCELTGSTIGFDAQEFSMVGAYTENLKKPQNGQNWGWVLARGWALAQDNTIPKKSQFTVVGIWECEFYGWGINRWGMYDYNGCGHYGLKG